MAINTGAATRRLGHVGAAGVALALLAGTSAPALAAGSTTRVSVGPGGAQANHTSLEPTISTNGRFVAFTSHASNLVPGDTNGFSDVFVRDLQTNTVTRASRDRQAGTTERVNFGPGGVQANTGVDSTSRISANGRFVAIYSRAKNLVAGDTNNRGDVFVRDRKEGTTTRVSVGPGGVQANEESGEGYRPDVAASSRTVIGRKGYSVVYGATATNLVPGDTNTVDDIFLTTR